MRIINNCTEVVLSSDILQNPGPFTLNVTINNCTTVPLQYTSDDVTVTTETNCGTDYDVHSICVRPEQLSCLESIPDGIISYNLTYHNTTDNVTLTESICSFSDCTIKCRLVSVVADNLESDILQKYTLLKSAGHCDNCDDLLTIYKCLVSDLKDLENGTTDSNTYTPCFNC